MKHIKDLRTYLARLRELGDLRELDREVDDDLELAAIARHATETLAPAVLFNRIRGCPQGYRALGAPVALSCCRMLPDARVAISLGMEPGTNPLEIVDALAASIDKPPILPELVEEAAACQEHVMEGEAVDLHRFPQPLLHVGDGGRYFSTLGAFVVRTPDRQWTNWTICRVMLVDRNRLVARFDSVHTRLIHNLWKERGEPMPFALVQGTEPAIMFASGMSLPERVDHGGYIGAHFGEPIEVVRCRTVDLEVPAAAEIVVEGHVSLDETTPEGPMGEYPGYVRGGPEPWPALHVSAITHRSDPLPFVGTGKPVDESHTICCLTYAAIYLASFRKAGIPATHVWWVPESSYSMMVVTLPRDWEQRTGISSSLQLTRRIAEIVVGNDPVNTNPDSVIARIAVFDDDIDPSDPRDLIWALSTRCHPTEGRVVIEQRILPLVMCYSHEERTRGRGPLVAFDGLLLSRPPDGEARPLSTAFADNYPRDLQQRILAAEDN